MDLPTSSSNPAAATRSRPDATADVAVQPPTLGKYELVEKIGSGGFGRVFKAWDPVVGRTVAIKTCEAANPEVRARFFREARLAGNLSHPNITTVHDLAIEGEMPYLVCEFLSGRDLSEVIAEGRLSVLEKIDVLIGIAAGLEHAHAAGVIHRDVKPANIRVLDGLLVKLMDFGIARSVYSDSNLTRTGVTLGSAAYMSPEQIRGELLDSRTDVFSLGAVAYELFTGVKAFRDPEVGNVLDLVLNADPKPLMDAAPGVPGAIAAIVHRALAKDREERYSSVAEIAADLLTARRGLLEAAGISEAVPAAAAAVRPTVPNEALPPAIAAPRSSFSGAPFWITAALILLAAFGAGALLAS